MTRPSQPPSTASLYAFEAVLHRRPDDATIAGHHADDWGLWPILGVSRESLSQPLVSGFDEAVDRLGQLPRMFIEPDGSFVWTSAAAERGWQVDGNLFERAGRVLLVDLKGSCPPAEFDLLLGAFGWPLEPVMLGLVRAAVFLDEATFRRHAAARGAAGDGQALRPR